MAPCNLHEDICITFVIFPTAQKKIVTKKENYSKLDSKFETKESEKYVCETT